MERREDAALFYAQGGKMSNGQTGLCPLGRGEVLRVCQTRNFDPAEIHPGIPSLSRGA